MIPAVINATPSEIFDTMDDVNCFNITWEPPPCAVGYNITTVYGGLAYSIPDPYTTICEVLCRETIRIQPIDNDGDGGYTTLVNGKEAKIFVIVLSFI